MVPAEDSRERSINPNPALAGRGPGCIRGRWRRCWRTARNASHRDTAQPPSNENPFQPQTSVLLGVAE